MLRDEIERVYRELRRIRSANEVDEGLTWTVYFPAREFSAIRGEEEPSDVERRTPSSSGCLGGSLHHPSFCALRGCPPTPQGQQVSQMCGRSPRPLPLWQSGVYCSQCEKPSGF